VRSKGELRLAGAFLQVAVQLMHANCNLSFSGNKAELEDMDSPDHASRATEGLVDMHDTIKLKESRISRLSKRFRIPLRKAST
jgi:hypothetical protein